MGRDSMGQMLTDLGDLLAARGLRYHLAVIGGTALLLRAVVDRTTRAVDAIGMLEDGEWVPLDELPPELAGAVPPMTARWYRSPLAARRSPRSVSICPIESRPIVK